MGASMSCSSPRSMSDDLSAPRQRNSVAILPQHCSVIDEEKNMAMHRPNTCTSVYQRKDLNRIHVDTLATALGFLDMFAICALFRVSKDFQRACKLALGQFTHIPSDERLYDTRVRAHILTVTHTYCRKAETMDWLILEEASEDCLAKILQRCTKLRRLDEFPYDNMTKLMRKVDRLPCTTHLDMWIYSAEDIEVIATRCSALRWIRLEWQGRTSEDYSKQFQKLFRNNRDLQTIELTNFQVGGVVPELVQLPHLAYVTIRPFLEDAHCKDIAKTPVLRKLNLQGNPRLTQVGIQSMLRVGMPDLRELSLQGSGVRPDFCQKVVSSKRFKTLDALTASGFSWQREDLE